jgi:hypothetical protein
MPEWLQDHRNHQRWQAYGLAAALLASQFAVLLLAALS